MTALDEWALTSSGTALPPRAPMLTPDAGRRTQGLLAAARAKPDSGELDTALG
jgi:hypothetical protein